MNVEPLSIITATALLKKTVLDKEQIVNLEKGIEDERYMDIIQKSILEISRELCRSQPNGYLGIKVTEVENSPGDATFTVRTSNGTHSSNIRLPKLNANFHQILYKHVETLLNPPTNDCESIAVLTSGSKPSI